MARPLAIEVRIARDHAGPTNPVLDEAGGNAANVGHGGGERAAMGVGLCSSTFFLISN